MTHSDEVTKKCQKPRPTDMSDGVMTPWKKNLLNLYALFRRQRRLLRRCKRRCAESCGYMIRQACAVTYSSQFKKRSVLTDTPEKQRSWRKSGSTRLQNPRILLRTQREVTGNGEADSGFLEVYAHQPFRTFLSLSVFANVSKTWRTPCSAG